jgi:hypothetical protein
MREKKNIAISRSAAQELIDRILGNNIIKALTI